MLDKKDITYRLQTKVPGRLLKIPSAHGKIKHPTQQSPETSPPKAHLYNKAPAYLTRLALPCKASPHLIKLSTPPIEITIAVQRIKIQIREV